MSFTFDVSQDVDLGGGYRLLAPGYRGTGRATEPSDYVGGVTRSATTMATLTATMAGALDRAGMREDQSIELTLVPEPGGVPSRSSSYGDAVILEAPDLGEDRGQLVMLTDEDGAVSFHFPVVSEDDQTVEGPSVRGAGGKKVYVIPADVPPAAVAADGEVGTRSLASTVGRKVLQVLTFPLVRAAGRLVGEPLVRWWESGNRPYGVRWFGPEHYRTPAPPEDAFAADDWRQLDGRRSLLFIHGTFSTSTGGFGSIPEAVMAGLSRRYEGRVIALDHPSLSATPTDNVSWLLDRIPPDVTLDVDVVAHSRGGLVARVLAGGHPDAPLDPGRIQVRSIVCAGTPNYGTALADPNRLQALCDRVATATNVVPGFGAGDVVDVLMLLVQYLAQGVLGGLRGLEVMDPSSDFLAALNRTVTDGVAYRGIAADYEPTVRGLKRIVAGVKDIGVDAVFEGAENDLVVPTVGVFAGGSRFAIDPSEVIRFEASRGVTHSTFWTEPEVGERLRTWLLGASTG